MDKSASTEQKEINHLKREISIALKKSHQERIKGTPLERYESQLSVLISETKEIIPLCGTRYHEHFTFRICQQRLSKLYVKRLQCDEKRSFLVKQLSHVV